MSGSLAWRSFRALPGEEAPESFPMYCSLCEAEVRALKYDVTELYTDQGLASRCGFAYKLSCGHIGVDDCNINSLNGKCFKDEEAWRKGVVTEPF